ncbi:hypothetical protein ACFV06_39830, partial [Streptomyces sp. NPDC059618]|uniref:hypothetical protein n=1 Tax=Streptomyces sp. NPDC059618 TaxID=3346887 RepID=UPI0036882B19
ILKLIGPLFLDELRAEFVANIHSRPGLRKLHERLGGMRFLDPAFMRKWSVSRDMAGALGSVRSDVLRARRRDLVGVA